MNKSEVILETKFGNIKLRLENEKAPKTVENFLHHVNAGHYDGTLFHRVIDNFMIQAGGFFPGMKQKEGPFEPIQNEANNGLRNDPYTVAMARTNDPHSATTQFFINVSNNEFLNHTAPGCSAWGYAVFGEVVFGRDVVDTIKRLKTGTKGFHQDVPMEDAIIIKARLVPQARGMLSCIYQIDEAGVFEGKNEKASSSSEDTEVLRTPEELAALKAHDQKLWSYRCYGSEPQKGYSICWGTGPNRDTLLHVGDSLTGEEIQILVNAHNAIVQG